MVIGGAVVQKEGMKGLALLIVGLLILAMFYGGIFGVILGVAGILLIFLLWFISGWHKSINSHKNLKFPKPKEKNWGEQIRKNLQAGLAEKYPDRFRDMWNK